MSGYTVRTEQIRVGVGEYLINNASTVDVVKTNFSTVSLPAAEAGQSVSGELKAVVSAWTQALPKVQKELELIGGAVNQSATMMEKVEVVGSARFEQFAS